MVKRIGLNVVGAAIGALLIIAGTSDSALARVYKWVDKDGNVHYSQKPPPKRAAAQSSKMISGDKERLHLPPRMKRRYCKGVRDIGTKVATKMRRGVSANSFLTSSHGASAPRLLVKQIVGFVYGFRASKLSVGDIANLVDAQCQNGSYNGYAEAVLKEAYPDGIPGAAGSTKEPPLAKKGAHSGTAWVAQGGFVVTNHHVVGTHKNVSLLTTSGVRLRATVVHRDKKNDVALLRVDNPSSLPPGLPIAPNPEAPGSDVFTIGYPHIGVMGRSPKVTKGIVSSVSGLGDDERFYQISVPVQSGNSGGPLFNMN
ncbi:MAG: trypsin-like peptidase domain-containing protein, partial [Gammaproteobacteria bacterium]|nr:trypsin-like peptidase domain-containing protein [Gammaproteobacteria bacterium]